MRSLDWPMLRGVLALSIPTVAVVLLGVWFMIDKVPSIVKTENQRIKEIYHAQAKELQSDRSLAIDVDIGKRGKSWMMSPGHWGFKHAKPGKTYVWYSEKKRLWVREVDSAEVADFSTIFWVCGSIVLLVLVVVTVAGVHFFVDSVRTRDDFVAETAHDLMTPLVVTRGFIGKDDEVARRANEQLIRIVDNLSRILKLGGRCAPPDAVKLDIPSLFANAYALFRDRYRAFSDGRDIEISGDMALTATGDETLVVQILWNLISNEIKYAAKLRYLVSVRFSSAEGFARVEISDTGPGLSKRERKRIFDRFYRTKLSRGSSSSGGFGIGLGNARTAARRMKGDITVAANESGGSTFVFTLPL